MNLKSFLIYAINVYQIVILIRVLMSWLPNSQNSRFGYFIYQLTEPLLGAIRRVMPNMGMIDLSPIIAFLILGLIQGLIAGKSVF